MDVSGESFTLQANVFLMKFLQWCDAVNEVLKDTLLNIDDVVPTQQDIL